MRYDAFAVVKGIDMGRKQREEYGLFVAGILPNEALLARNILIAHTVY